ncbi:hydrolase [Rhizobium sp. H4]|uniref:amidohydrolase n=1 Tax=Rhizobium TaxID=379 RepID=UPI000BE8706B|nr:MULTISPECIES: amidohydrolase [Rhizobium]PDV85635.1 hydrolase [Rhizobium sp. H4]WET73195.1 amidohydrolase [Rhizobium croatiense]
MTASAELIITNGRVLSMNPDQPEAEAIAIAGGRILAVGSRNAIAAYRNSATHMIDAGGATVTPGMNESHIHLFGGSSELDQLSLFNVKGYEAMKAAVLAYAASRPTDPLLLANGCDYTILGADRGVDRQVLDSILPDRPLAVMSPDHHTIWANSIALAKAGILKGRTLPLGNEIVMGEDGLATGELREHYAFDDVIALGANGGRDLLGLSTGGEPDPEPSAAERAYDRALLKRGLRHLAAHGITSFQNMDGNRYQLELLSEIQAEGGLICRGRIPFHYTGGDIVSQMDKAAQMRADFNGEWLNAGTVKMFMDGVLDSHTAVMYDDYADRPGWKGEQRFDQAIFDRVCIEADKRGLQIAVHAIGDGAVAKVIDGYAAVEASNGKRDSRHRIEHIEVVRTGDLTRMAKMKIIASMQPTVPPGQMGLPLEPTLSRIGRENWARSYAWRAIRDAGIDLIFSTDWPVSPVSPMLSMHSAMTRKPWTDDQPDNRQTLMETLDAYTVRRAYAEFADGWKGQLKAGFAADIVVWDHDLQAIEPDEMVNVAPRYTICGGQITYAA